MMSHKAELSKTEFDEMSEMISAIRDCVIALHHESFSDDRFGAMKPAARAAAFDLGVLSALLSVHFSNWPRHRRDKIVSLIVADIGTARSYLEAEEEADASQREATN